MGERVMIAMSGGVDSAVAAYLVSKNAAAAGVTMSLCPRQNPGTDADIADAAALCAGIGIPHFAPHFEEEFRRLVMEPFAAAYERAETPNPCVDCNREIKFGKLLDFACQNGFSRLATGHYARTEHAGGRTLLLRAKDASKDQSYMLFSLTQEVLSRVLFPLGELTKDEVRAIAEGLSFPMAKKRDSQDICFIPDGDYAAFIRGLTGKDYPSGNFIDKDGRILGKHEGILRYTVGQRKGLGIAMGHPIFVTKKSAADNTVTLGESEELFSKQLVARGINLIPFDHLETPLLCQAKVRYRQDANPARVEQTGTDELTVEFATPQRAVAPGQALVLYDGDYVLGGGKIVAS